MVKAIDLFAGAGGASLGLAAAGLEVVAAYELDPDACATHARHAPGRVVRCDLAEFAADAVPEAALWWASPPCQAFSSAGRRAGAADARNGFPHLLRLVRARRPRWLLVENVVGLTYHKKSAGCLPLFPRPDACPACYLAQVLGALGELFPSVEARVLDAADYGVPQFRKRVIVVCGPAPIAWPAPTHGSGRAHPHVTMRRALGLTGGYSAGRAKAYYQGGRSCDVEAPAPTVGASSMAEFLSPLDRPSPTICVNDNDMPFGDVEVRDRVRAALAGVLDRPAPTITGSVRVGPDEAPARASRRPWVGVHRALAQRSVLDEPSYTISAGGTDTGGGTETFPNRRHREHLASELAAARLLDRPEHDGRLPRRHLPAGHHVKHKAGAVRLSLAQLAVLQGLPASFVCEGRTKKSHHRQIGNAVPPALAEAVARAVLATDAWLPRRPPRG